MKPSLNTRPRVPHGAQHGGFFLGVVIGLLLGLVLALGVALYVTKTPVPFINKVFQHGTGENAAEIEKNKNWDPNGGLAGTATARPAPSASAASTPVAPEFVSGPNAPAVGSNPPGATLAASAPKKDARDPPASLGDKAVEADPGAVSTDSGSDPFTYYVQAGAYVRGDEAEQQRARMAMLGLEARVTEREQAGRTIYRVRMGPYEKKDEADAARERLEAAGVESALVRVQR